MREKKMHIQHLTRIYHLQKWAFMYISLHLKMKTKIQHFSTIPRKYPIVFSNVESFRKLRNVSKQPNNPAAAEEEHCIMQLHASRWFGCLTNCSTDSNQRRCFGLERIMNMSWEAVPTSWLSLYNSRSCFHPDYCMAPVWKVCRTTIVSILEDQRFLIKELGKETNFIAQE